MASQIMQLLIDLNRELKGIETTQQTQERTLEQMRMHCDDLLQRVATLENDKEWAGDERRSVKERLGSGDHTFLRMQSEIADAQQVAEAAHGMAKSALAAAEAARDGLQDRPTGFWANTKKYALESLGPIAVTAVWWLLYHMLLIGPKIAALMKAAHHE